MTRGCGATDGTGTTMLIGTISLVDTVGIPGNLTVPNIDVGQRPHRMREAGYPKTQDLTDHNARWYDNPAWRTRRHGSRY